MPEAVVVPVTPAAPVTPAPVTPGPSVKTEIPVFTEQTYDETGVRPAAPVKTVTPAEGDTPVQKPADQAPAAPAEDDRPTDESTEGRTGKNRYSRRLDKANRKYYEEKARAEFLERQLAEAKPKEQPMAGAPRLEDFTDINEYAKAYAKHESQNAIKQYEQKQQEESFKRATQHLAAQWEDKVSRADRKYDDFDDIVGELAPTNPVSIAIMQAENGEDIAYYLGTHLKEAQRISTLDPLSQAREIGRLETKLLAEPPKAKTPSKAPAPITPIAGKMAPASDEPLDTDDINTWMKKANAKSRKAIGA
jgi:hypothetical protein